jgi:hypothetical protein
VPYGRRPRLGRLDRVILGASPEKLAARKDEDVSAVDVPALTDAQQTELYRLNYRRQVSTLSPSEEAMRQRLVSIARGRK